MYHNEKIMKNIFALDNPRIEKKFICYDLNYKDVAIIIKTNI